MGRCYNSAVIDAPSDEVWQTIRDFHALEWASGVITDIEVVGERGGGEIGAQRVLNGAFHETLQSLDDEARTFTYSIDDGPGPVASDAVSNYVGRVRVFPITDSNRTFIEWESTYESDNDAAVGELCNPIYGALLQRLQEHFA